MEIIEYELAEFWLSPIIENNSAKFIHRCYSDLSKAS